MVGAGSWRYLAIFFKGDFSKQVDEGVRIPNLVITCSEFALNHEILLPVQVA